MFFSMNVFALAPAILPSMAGLSARQLVALKTPIAETAKRQGFACEAGNFGLTAQEFDLYADIADAGADYRHFYALRFRIPYQPLETAQLDSNPQPLVTICSDIEIRVFDEMIAIATLEARLALSAEHDFANSPGKLDALIVTTISRACKDALCRVDQCIQLTKDVVHPKGVLKKDLMSPQGLDQPSIGWVHKVFLPNEESLHHLSDRSDFAQALVAPLTLKEFMPDTDYFGWGDSIKISDHSLPNNRSQSWRDGCVISQYYYFALDRFNRRVPELIFKLRSSVETDSLTMTRTLGMDLRHRVAEKDIAYADFLHGVAGDCRLPVESYDVRWRFADLRRNLASKLPILQDVLNEVQELSQRRTNATVETLLSIFSIFGLISLLLSSHDYVAKSPTDKVGTEDVLMATFSGIHDILSVSVWLALFFLFIVTYIRFGIRQRVMRWFKR